jgi:hypothetical protein
MLIKKMVQKMSPFGFSVALRTGEYGLLDAVGKSSLSWLIVAFLRSREEMTVFRDLARERVVGCTNALICTNK